MNNQPKGDVWMLRDNDAESQNNRTNFKCDYSFIASEDIKDTVKAYIWMNYRTGNRTLVKLYGDIGNFNHFNEFAKSRNIVRFVDLTNNDISMFISFLRTKISDTTHKSLAYQSQKKLLDTLKSIIHWCQIHMPNGVPDREIFTGSEYIGINRKLKIEFIPDDVLAKINEALKTEENLYIKYGIIILETTGMRLGDLLKLTIDCIKPHLISGYTINWFDYKNRKERPSMPIPNECAVAVKKLIEYTLELREQADGSIKDYIFIHKVTKGNQAGKIMNINQMTIGNWFNSFIGRNNIQDANGEFYNLTAHQFRRTLATDMLSKGTNIKVIQEVLGHTAVSTTKLHYADVKDKERAETFKNIGIIGNINQVDASVIDNPVELEWFKANKNKCVAGLCDGYCTKPFTGGKICDRLLKRQKCYTCSRYITTPEYLEAHKNHLKSLEHQLEANIYGEHYAEHFIPTIEILKIIINRLEHSCNDLY
jgi:integrase